MNTINGSFYWLINEAVIFFTFIAICGILTPLKFNKKINCITILGFITGITSLNIILLLTQCPAVQVLGLLPLTAYVPMIICFHIISKVSFFQTAAIWNIGLIEYFLLKLIIKITDSMLIHNNILAPDLLNSVTVISIAILILFFLSKYIKKPLKQYMLELKSVWFITCLPLIFACVLFSYASWSTVNLVLLAILLLIFIVIFLTLAKMLNSAYEAMRLKQNEFNLEIQIETQKHEYKEICSKMEKGRAFRHDMHHHFSTLNSLLQQGETEDALSYIHNLNNEYIEIEQELFCENSTVNAILTYYTQQAKNTNCLFDVNVKIGKEPVFEDMDLCVIFSNSLENAINACKKIEDKCQRHISVSANCQNGKLAISVQNSCFELIKFDQDGFPIVPKTEGHGVGLKSIESVTKKYNGVFSCSLIENMFSIKTVIFANNELPPTVKKASKSVLKQVVLNACFLIFSFSLFINATPALADTFENIPIANQLIGIITLKSFGFQWGDSQLKIDHPIVELEKSADINNALTSPNTSSTFSEENLSSLDNLNPLSSTSTDNTSLTSSQKKQNMDNETTSPKRKDEITVNDSNSFPIIIQTPSTSDDSNSSTENNEENSSDLSEGIDDINNQMEKYVEQLRQEFIKYLSIKYNGYAGMDTIYKIICNNDTMISIRFYTVINLGGSTEVNRIFTLDKKSGKVLTLENLFIEGSDYIKIISNDILKQMKIQVDAGLADYFIPGGFWPNDECFKEIDTTQNFYINSDGKLVIVFDEYVVAPGSMGSPEFIISTDILKNILTNPSLIK